MRTRFLFASVVLTAANASGRNEPDRNRQLMERVCTACHGLDVFVTERHTRAEWQDIVDEMVTLGAPASPGQVKTLVGYLTKQYGKQPPKK